MAGLVTWNSYSSRRMLLPANFSDVWFGLPLPRHQDKEPRDFSFAEGENKVQNQRVRQSGFIEIAPNLSRKNDVAEVLSRSQDFHAESFAHDFAANPVLNRRFAPKIAQLIVYVRILLEKVDQAAGIKVIDRLHKGNNDIASDTAPSLRTLIRLDHDFSRSLHCRRELNLIKFNAASCYTLLVLGTGRLGYLLYAKRHSQSGRWIFWHPASNYGRAIDLE
ncbi:hypothetical protein LT85_2512 [Collimonas arenae]|uniref:Uncharacterized protein n=1 Tax=Collimonas arenae TaxID=279058 RepID=A0A0A1FD17_9BURK|nr:hypothetical protein LT85_2512 [Collimonas arenae]